jgi:hypothetical protein
MAAAFRAVLTPPRGVGSLRRSRTSSPEKRGSGTKIAMDGGWNCKSLANSWSAPPLALRKDDP